MRTGTPGSQHQLKAVKVNEGRRGVWHRSIRAHKGRFSKSRESSNRRTPGGRLSLRGSYLGSAFGAAAFPEATRREAARGKPPTQTAPSRSSASRRAAEPPSAPRCRRAIFRASTARTSRSQAPPRPPLPVKCGSARPHTRSRPERAARCACPVPVWGESERALARRAAAGQLRSPDLTCSRVAKSVVDPQRWRKTGGWDPVGGREEGGKEARHGAQLSRR